MKKPTKAYQDLDFLNSSDGRTIRMLTEYLQPKSKFKKHKIMDTIVFFGSARLKAKKDALKDYNKIKSSN
ncbi:MAG: lysine decarboxylase, partial [Ignavibacteriaceae bacterium]